MVSSSPSLQACSDMPFLKLILTVMIALQEQERRPTEPPEATPNCDDSLTRTGTAADGVFKDTGNGTGAKPNEMGKKA